MCGVVWCYTGPHDKADEVFAPMRAFGAPAFHFDGADAVPGAAELLRPAVPPGHQWYWRADFVNELSDEAIEQHVEAWHALPTLLSTMHLYPIDGAVHASAATTPRSATATSNWAEVIVGVDPDPANKAPITDWCKRYWDALHPHGAGGAYVNFMMDEGQERVQATYRDNYERLVAIKRQVDPDNLFRVNQNIQPGR